MPQLRRILIVTDSWLPQVNSTVRMLEAIIAGLTQAGHAVELVAAGQEGSFTMPLPFARGIRLEPFGLKRVEKAIAAFNPDCIHIATEGALGLAARHLCLAQNRPFTTSCHAIVPEHLAARAYSRATIDTHRRSFAGFLA